MRVAAVHHCNSMGARDIGLQRIIYIVKVKGGGRESGNVVIDPFKDREITL